MGAKIDFYAGVYTYIPAIIALTICHVAKLQLIIHARAVGGLGLHSKFRHKVWTNSYHIAGNFHGRKFSRIVNFRVFYFCVSGPTK